MHNQMIGDVGKRRVNYQVVQSKQVDGNLDFRFDFWPKCGSKLLGFNSVVVSEHASRQRNYVNTRMNLYEPKTKVLAKSILYFPSCFVDMTRQRSAPCANTCNAVECCG